MRDGPTGRRGEKSSAITAGLWTIGPRAHSYP
jgi:hypothetical protein